MRCARRLGGTPWRAAARRLLVVLLAACCLPLAHAEALRLAGDGERAVYLGVGRDAYRFGNAVLTWLYYAAGARPRALQRMLVSCDGAWASDASLPYWLPDDVPAATPGEVIAAATRRADQQFTREAQLVEWDRSLLQSYDDLRAAMPGICAHARPEPRGLFFPVTDTVDGRNQARVWSVVSGTFRRRAGSSVADVWVRAERANGTPVFEPHALPWARGADELTLWGVDRSRTVMRHLAVDCESGRMSAWASVEYDQDGNAMEEGSFAEDPATTRLETVPAGSIGRAQVDAICRIYGGDLRSAGLDGGPLR